MAFAEIHSVDTMTEVGHHFAKADGSTLGIFDIDETLVLTTNPSFQRPNIEKNRAAIPDLFKGLSEEDKFVVLNLTLAHSEAQLIEKQTPDMLASLQKKGVKIIALTGASPCTLRSIDLCEKRISTLKKLGIDFSSSFPKDQIVFDQLKPSLGVYPTYKQGILFANGDFRKNKDVNSKGDVLVSFLTAVCWTPKRVIFVDDKREHLEYVEEALRTFDPQIEFIGLHYTGAKKFPSPEISPAEFEQTWREIISMLRAG